MPRLERVCELARSTSASAPPDLFWDLTSPWLFQLKLPSFCFAHHITASDQLVIVTTNTAPPTALRPVCLRTAVHLAATAPSSAHNAHAPHTHTTSARPLTNFLRHTATAQGYNSSFVGSTTSPGSPFLSINPQLPVRRLLSVRPVSSHLHDVTGGTHSRAGPSNGKSAPALSRRETVLVTPWPTLPNKQGNAYSCNGDASP